MAKKKDEAEEDVMWTITRVCEFLGCSRPTIYKLFESGELTKIKILGSLRIRRSEVMRLVKQSEIPAGQ